MDQTYQRLEFKGAGHAHNVPPADAIRWLEKTGLSIDELHPDAKFRILAMYLELDDTPSALDLIEKLKDADYETMPALLFLAGHAYLGHVVHSDLRNALLAPLPPDLADFPLANDTQAMAHRRKAVEFYNKANAALTILGATRAASVAADRALWLQLRDPTFIDEAMDVLHSSLANEGVRLRRVPIAFAFNVGLNLQAVEDDIDRATALSGGSSADAAIARLEVALHRKAPEVADYIEKHRKQLLTYYRPEFLTSIEIESLCKAGRTGEARSRLTELERKDLPSNSLVTLRSLIESAAGADVAAMREAEYRKSPGVPALMNLIVELRRIRDFPKLAEFSEILFEQVRDIASAESYVGALYELHSDEKIADFGNLYSEIVDASQTVGNTVAWALYRLGRLGDAKKRLEKLKSGRDVQSDRFLATNIAVASGDWSSLGAFVESEWQKREERGPAELLRAGVLAQRIGATARSQELVRAAVSKADGDAGILVTAYSTASSAGWENEEDIHGWLEGAIAASGENGPVQRMDIRDLLDGQPEWNDRLDRTSELVVQGEAPLFAAAKVANRTLLDLFLRPALANLGQTDLRRKSPIFAFGGTKPIRKGVSKRVAVDITSLLTLGLTGQLSKFVGWAETVTIAHSTLGWLFEERDKLAFHQPSQVRKAREVKQLIDNGRLHRFEGAASDQALEMRVGDDIARYLVAAQTIDEKDKSQKMVVRPAPLPKPGSLLQESADISGLEDYFAGVGDVLSALRLGGQLSEVESRNAEAYLRLQEQPWPHNPVVQPGATLYLDDVALSFLQHLGLLARLQMAGFKVYVTSSEVERANVLVGYDSSADEARKIVEDLQVTLRDAIASGKVKLGRLFEGEEGGDEFDMHPSRLLLSDRPEVETLVIDDRFINRFATHDTYAIASSVDLLATMAADSALTAEQLMEAITVIRQAGLLFTPFGDGEVASLLNSAPIVDVRIQETAELKAMRDSVLLARMTDGLQLPGENAWIDSLLREVLAALRSQWQDSITDEVARVRSSWLLQFLDPRGWSHRSTAAGLNAADRQRAQVLALLIMPRSDDAVRRRYWNWLEEAVLAGFREEQPESYVELVKTIRQIVEERLATTLSEGTMANNPDLRGPLALELLRLFPKSIRDEIAGDTSFREQFDLTADSTLSLNGLGISLKGSDLFAAVRTLLEGSADSVQVQPLKGQPLELSIERGQRHKLFLAVEGNRQLMPTFWMLSNDQAVRLAFFSDEIETENLPTATIKMWRERLEKSSLTEEEMDELKRTRELIPQSVAESIREEFKQLKGRVKVAVPRDDMYYRFLIGERGAASNVEEYAQRGAKEHIDRLLRWDFKQGLAQCLLFCASPSLSGLIDISDQPAADVEEFFAWLSEHGDRFSQVAGIEVGIRSLQNFPSLEPIIMRMVEEIRDEDPDAKTSRSALAVNLLVFVDGELSRIRLFRDEPPFWRRIAAVAQAAMIERELIAAGGAEDDTSDWRRMRAEHFYMQSLADLRHQPRCIPDLISATQFRIEFLMRARIVGHQIGKGMPETPLRDLLLGSGDESLEKHTLVPSSSAPGPVEGGIDGSTAVPEEIVNELRKLSGDAPLEARAFASVVNFCLVFRFNEEVAGLIVNILRKVQYRLNLEQDSDVGFSLIMGLAIIAAAARHAALADEVRILARVLRRRGIIGAAADNQMRIALVACASREDLEDWCKAVGEWLFEIANGEMSQEEAARTRSRLHVLCHAVPELWPYVAKADAALAAMSS